MKFNMVPLNGEVFLQGPGHIDADLVRDVEDGSAIDTNKVMMAAGVRIVSLSFGIYRQFSERTFLRECIEGIVNRGKRHRLIFLGYRTKNFFS